MNAVERWFVNKNVLKTRAVVKAGGLVEVRAPELPTGVVVEVIVIVDTASPDPPALVSLLGAARGGFATVEDANAFLRNERDAWES